MRPLPVALGLLRREGRYFLQRRDPGAAVLPGCWEFPGGKLGPSETPEAALARELQEELGLAPRILEALEPLEHAYPGLAVRLHPFLLAVAEAPRTALAWGWFTPAQMRRLPVPEANRPLVERLADRA